MKKLIIVLLLSPLFSGAQYTAASRVITGKGETIVTKWIRGYVDLKNGTRKEGEIQLKVLNADTVEIRVKSSDRKEKFAREEVADFRGILLIQDMKNDYNQPYRNFHPGKIFMDDGVERTGRVAANIREANEMDGSKIFGPVGVKFAEDNDEVTIHRAEKTDVVYFIQTIEGTDYHYVKVGRQFIAVGNPTGRFSYFRNPNPTHVREGATNFTKSAVEQVGQELAEEAAQKAAEKSVQQSQQSGEDLVTTMGNATVAATRAANEVEELFTLDDDGAIYFEEYFIVDNKKFTKSVVYKKNIDQVLFKLLEGCGVDDKIPDVTNGIKELTEVMTFLEEHICN